VHKEGSETRQRPDPTVVKDTLDCGRSSGRPGVPQRNDGCKEVIHNDANSNPVGPSIESRTTGTTMTDGYDIGLTQNDERRLNGARSILEGAKLNFTTTRRLGKCPTVQVV
jgi:hypothetical protein